MTSYIHQVTNKSGRDIHVVVLSPSLQMSYDLVLGAGEHVQYDKLLGPGAAPVPRAEDAGQFDANRIKLRIGANWFSIYECKAKVRVAKGAAFDVNAPEIAGQSAYPTIELVIAADESIHAEIYPMLRGSGLAYAYWTTASDGLYGVGDDGNLIQKVSTSFAEWQPWSDLGKPPAGLAGPVTAVSWVAQRYSVYALGTDGMMYERSWLTSRWEQWMIHAPPPQVTLAGLSAVSWIAGQYAVYATGTNGNLYEKFWKVDHWVDWSFLGRPADTALTGPITAVSWSSSRYGIYALGEDGNVWQKWWATSWSDWESIGKPPGDVTIKTLSSVCLSDRCYVVAAVCSDKSLWVRRYQRGWYDWEKIGSPGPGLDGPLAAGMYSYANYVYYARAADGALYYHEPKWGWHLVDGS